MRKNIILSSLKKFLILFFSVFFSSLAISSIGASAEEISSSILPKDESTLIKRKNIFIIKKRIEKRETKGIVLGNYVLSPSVFLTEYYDDNIYATNTGTRDDLITVITPTLNLKSNWEKHAIELDAGLEITRHADLATENTNNAWLNMKGKYVLNKKHNLFVGLDYIRDHEDRTSPDAEAGYEPTKFYDTSANVGYTGHKGNNYFSLVYKNTNLDFYDVNSLSGIIDNDDRDRNDNAVGLRYLYKYSPSGALFIKAVLDKRDYVQTLDNEGNDRVSDGYRYSAGLELVGENTVSKIFIGSLNRDYQSSVFEDAKEFDFGLQHNWKFLSSSSLAIKVSRSIEETTLNGSPGYLMTDGSMYLSFSLASNKILSFETMLSTAEYYSNSRKDDYFDYGVGYSQKILNNLQFSINLHRGERDSNITGQDYKINQVFLHINAAI